MMLLLALLLPLEFVAAEAQGEEMVAQSHSEGSPPLFLTASQVQQIVRAEKSGVAEEDPEVARLSLSTESMAKVARHVQVFEHFKELHRKEGNLTAEGFFSFWPSHAQYRYANEYRETRLEEMIARAELALVAHVEASESGITMGGFLATRIDLVVERVLGPPAPAVNEGARFWAVMPYYDVVIDRERFCSKREGFHDPQVGALMLFSASRHASRGGLLPVASYFLVEGDEMELQPYGFIEPNSMQLLVDLSTARLDAGAEEAAA
ncbi:MAG: hypothetical protein KDD11_13565 [Acidobacteria bacterium]|nr:hypothetical protein [Acidobacteriota bacterium]